MTREALPKPAAAPASSWKPAAASLKPRCSCGGNGDSECEECQRKKLQRSAAGPAAASVPPIVGRVLDTSGAPLDPGARSFLEPRFGHDFSGVRVHDDARAGESAKDVRAHAYTVGDHIVFAPGKYAPRSREGLHLLAHELAHTRQQAGLRRSAADVQMGGPSDIHLEHEAEAAARVVMAGPSQAGVTSHLSRSRSPVVLRAEAAPAPEAATDLVPAPDFREWNPKLPTWLTQEDVDAWAAPQRDIWAFRLKKLVLPGQKGPVLETWQKRAQENKLQAVVGPDGTIKEATVNTTEKRRFWLEKMLITEDTAIEAWSKAAESLKMKAEQKSDKFEPRIMGEAVCDMDHIIELQFGGSNTPENFQTLDQSSNRSSGSQIKANLERTGKTILEDIKRGVGSTPRAVVLQVAAIGVTQPEAPVAGSCTRMQKQMEGMRGVRSQALGGKEVLEGEAYPIEATSRTDLDLTIEAKKTKGGIEIKESSLARNRAASSLIPGLSLDELHLSASKKEDKIHFSFAKGKWGFEKDETKKNAKEVSTFKIDPETKKLKLATENAGISIIYPYLSTGTIKKLAYEPSTGLIGSGEIRPSLPLLNKLVFGFEFSQEKFEIVSGLDEPSLKKLSPPIPGAQFTKAQLSLLLWPKFLPSGNIDFVYAAGGKTLLDASLEATRDDNGFVLTGNLNAYLPGVDKAAGKIEYRNRQWSGGARVESSQIKLPFIENGALTVGFDGKGVHADGLVSLAIPIGGQKQRVEVTVEKQKSGWVYRGKGMFKIPHVDDAELTITYDGAALTGKGRTKFSVLGLTGNLDLAYTADQQGNEKVSGTGDLAIAKKRAKGNLAVKLTPAGKISGSGHLSYQISEGLVAEAGVALDENENLQVKGVLAFVKPIPLFKGIKGTRELFKAGLAIPIPGASIGGFGLKFTIDGSLGVSYLIGPGELRDAKVQGEIRLLEPMTDLDIQIAGLLYIPASAGIYGSVRGAAELDALVASVSGGLTVTCSADLDGKVQAAAVIHYKKGRFDVGADSEIAAGLILGVKLDSDVTLSALGYELRKVWSLAAYKYDTGVRFGMKARILYASDQPFKIPEIEFVKPQLRIPDLLTKSVQGAGGKETRK
jgi:hypothetical protein